jgi:hypothetical protein
MAFTQAQRGALNAKLSAAHVRTRRHDGRDLAYLEGWHVIAEANRIFGFDGWDRASEELVCVLSQTGGGETRCIYRAKVRVSVRAGRNRVTRDGHGCGEASHRLPGEAHARALKEAETDATKRALVTFGNVFGLALYDPSRRNVTGYPDHGRYAQAVCWPLSAGAGGPIARFEDPVAWCSPFRRQAEQTLSRGELERLVRQNAAVLEQIVRELPDLRTERGEHYVDLLHRLVAERRRAFGGPPAEERATSRADASSTTASPAAEPAERYATTGIDKSVLALPAPRRIKAPAHLEHVRQQPCLVCGRRPVEAHHLTFAQDRAIGRKAGNDWTVPVCRAHHRALHAAGAEEKWWQGQGIDPLSAAEALWRASRDVA